MQSTIGATQSPFASRPRSENELYLRDPYYIVPDGDVGRQAFAVIRDAIRKSLVPEE